MVEFPPVYRPKPYSKPTAHLKSHLRVLLDDGAEIATFVYTPNTSDGEKPCEDLASTAAYLASIPNDTFATPIVFLHGNGEEHGIFGTIIDEVCSRGYIAIGIDSRDQGLSTRGTAA
ncbi:MAG: alpha/beta hydrolase, partial [Atopobium sp.]|nr:alpha/beta hydrolase [Atopobium sp.]